jgi:uncharacterized membrane protein
MTKIYNTYKRHKESLTPAQRFAVWLTNRVGTIGFFTLILLWTIFWMLWNVYAPVNWRFDPYPAFVMWLFISNMIQIFLMPLIMVGQNLQGRHAEMRAENDYQVNLRSEKEIDALHKKVDELLEEVRRLKKS